MANFSKLHNASVALQNDTTVKRAAPQTTQPAAASTANTTQTAQQTIAPATSIRELRQRADMSKAGEEFIQRAADTLSGSAKLYGAQGAGILEALANVEQAYREAPGESVSERNMQGNNARVWGNAPTVEQAQQQAQRYQQLGSSLKESGSKDVERAKEGLGWLGQRAVDVGVAGSQMLGDVGVSVLTGGTGAIIPMIARSFGGGVQEAREKGYNVEQQIESGIAKAATEYLSEKLFGGNPIYDKQKAGLINRLVGKISSNEKLLAALASTPADIIGEGLEEVFSDFVEPIANAIISRGETKWNDWEFDQMLNDFIVGSALGALGQGGQYVKNNIVGNTAPTQTTQGGAQTAPIAAGARQTSAESNFASQANEGAAAQISPQNAAPKQTMQNAAPAAQPQAAVSPVELAVRALQNGQKPTNAQTKALIKDDAALRALGIDPSGKTASQLRAEIKTMAGAAPTQQNAAVPSETTAIDTNLAGHTAEERAVIEGYKNAVDNSLLDWINRVRAAFSSGDKSAQKMKKVFGEVAPKTAEAVRAATGIDTTGFEHMIDGSAVQHDATRHGKNGEADASMENPEDLARIKYVLDNFDTCELSKKDDGTARTSHQFRDKNNKPAPKVVFTKKVDGTYYVVEAVADSADKKLHVISAYMSDNNSSGSVNQVPNMGNPPQPTPEAPLGPVAPAQDNNIVAQQSNDVKSEQGAEKSAPQETESGDDSLGSARGGFDPFSAAENRYGTQDGGMNAVRPDDAPVSTNGKDRVSRSVVSAKGAAVTPDDFVPLLEKSTMKGDFSFIPITNDATAQSAMEFIEAHGWDDALSMWRKDAARGRYSPTMNAVGQLLYNNAVNAGNSKLALDIFGDYQATLRNSAQILQSARILKNMTPMNRLYMIQKSIAQFMQDANVPDGIKLSDEVKQAYLNAKTEAERNDVIQQMQREVAEQLPSTALDKWNALRYVNMLGNFKTQVRNVAGNVGMQALSRVKNGIATALEGIAYSASGGKFERTKAMMPGKARLDAARADFAEIEKIALGESKYSLHEGNNAADFMSGAEDMKTVFKFGDNPLTRALGVEGKKGGAIYRTLEAYRKATNWAMEKGDVIFSRSSYANALAGYLKAHGITAEQFTDESWRENNADFVDKARAFAIKEAQEATFRDTNAVSKWVSQIGRKKDTPAAVRVMGEGLLPFRKTPANVAVRAEEYSPLGFINTAVKAAQAAKGADNVTGADVINQLSKTLTGTGVFALGMWLRSMGKLRGGDDEDKNQQYFDDLTGHQNYALEVESPDGDGKYSYTIDWLTPGSIPLFMGAQLYDAMEENGLQFADVEKALTQVADPMLEMSMLSGVNDVIDELKYGNDNFGQLLGTMFVSYATQGLTNTLLGQFERINEPERMSTYVDKDSQIPTWLQRQIGKASAKTPGWDYQQYPYVNALGQHESSGSEAERAVTNLLSPGYLSRISDGKLETELQRVADKTGNTAIFPDNAAKYITVDGETKNLTQDEYEQYATTAGRTFVMMANAIINGNKYGKLSDEEKADVFSKVNTYAKAVAKQEITGSTDALTGEARTVEKAAEAQKAGIDPSAYFLLKVAHDEINNGSGSADEKATRFADYIDKTEWLTDTQRELVKSLLTYGGGYSGSANERALSAVENGTVTMDEYYEIKAKYDASRNGESASKGRLVDFIDANFPPERRWEMFELYQGGGEGKNKWKNPY